MDIIKAELLYFLGCPSYKQAWADLLEVIVENKLDVSVRPRNIDSLEKATDLPFAGSPTILVNGVDLENYAGEAIMACRIYQGNDGNGWPEIALIRKALLAANG